MKTSVSDDKSRTFSPTKILLAAGVTLLLAGLAGCGGPNVDYEAFCETERQCYGEASFNQTYGSIGACADEYRSKIADRSGDCQRHSRSYLSCLANNGGRCEGGSACAQETVNMISACGTNWVL